VDALDLGVLELRPVRVLEAEAVAEVLELQPHAVVEISLELDAANLAHRKSPSFTAGRWLCTPELSGRFLPTCPTH
jgi:hypothetical protein